MQVFLVYRKHLNFVVALVNADGESTLQVCLRLKHVFPFLLLSLNDLDNIAVSDVLSHFVKDGENHVR